MRKSLTTHYKLFYLGAFVEIGNLPGTTSVYQDTTASVLVFSVSVYPPMTGECAFANGNDDGNFIITDIGNGKSVCLVYNCSKMSRLMTKPTKWHVRPAKTQISLGIRPV